MELKITLEQMESLLNQQKRLVIEKLLQHTGSYNKESTGSVYKTLPIDPEKFKDQGMGANYPDDYTTLKKYLKP